MSLFLVRFRAGDKFFAVRVIARMTRQAMQVARHDLLRACPELKQVSITLESCGRLGPQVDEVEGE